MVFDMIPLKDFVFFVCPIAVPLFVINLFNMINSTLNIYFLFVSIFIVSILVFLFSELGFNENGLKKLLELIFNSKDEHIENFKKE